MLRRTRLRPRSKKRQAQAPIYSTRRLQYLEAHPLDQIFMAVHRIEEGKVLTEWQRCKEAGLCLSQLEWGELSIPFADQIHHRNKSNGPRLLIEEFWMAASLQTHHWVEQHKDEAREIGLLCPINARPDGGLPDGAKCVTTAELIELRSHGHDCTRKFGPDAYL